MIILRTTILLVVMIYSMYAQETSREQIIGKVEYISSQFTYVNFENTKGIEEGDTLFIYSGNKLMPKLVVKSLSSRSCAAISILGKVSKGKEIIALIENNNVDETVNPKLNENIVLQDKEIMPKETTSNYGKFRKSNQGIYGRFSLSGYSNLSNEKNREDYQNWRYSLSLNTDKINGSRFSFSSYITFRYRADEWNYVKSNFGDALKIYNLAVNYSLTQKTNFTLGRKINRKISNIGAVDGLQFETEYKSFSIGAVVGSRPNFSDYGLNINLLEIGGYINRTDSLGKGAMQNTISAFQQMNDNTTDRRFIYLQHSNNIFSKFNLFSSTEIDLFKKENGNNTNDFRLTSFYINARYSPARWISTSASYDARKNVIYYETFKNYADQLIESALRQGFRFRVNLRPIKYVFLSMYTGYRFRDDDIKPSRNFGTSVTHSRIPYINLSANISYIKLNSSYLDGNILGLRLSRDFWNGQIYGTLGYRKVDYTFTTTESKLQQNIFMIDLSTRLSKTMSFSISFEGTYEDKASHSNIYANFTKRF